MNLYSDSSEDRIKELHPKLVSICRMVLGIMDHSIIYTYRSSDLQDHLFAQGKSKLRGGFSKHNLLPSHAVDIAPYIKGRGTLTGNDKRDYKYFYQLAGVFQACANSLSIRIRWGGDWDGDSDLDDQSFNDLFHFELLDLA